MLADRAMSLCREWLTGSKLREQDELITQRHIVACLLQGRALANSVNDTFLYVTLVWLSAACYSEVRPSLYGVPSHRERPRNYIQLQSTTVSNSTCRRANMLTLADMLGLAATC